MYSVSCWQENRPSQISETDGRGSDLQATPPGRTFLSGTCGPAPTYRWQGYPQCPGRWGIDKVRERHLWNSAEVCVDHSPLLVLEPSGSASTPDCSQTHLQRHRQPVNHSAFMTVGELRSQGRNTPKKGSPLLILYILEPRSWSKHT